MKELPGIMASLEIQESPVTPVESAEEETVEPESSDMPVPKNTVPLTTRVLRKRIHSPYQSHESSKRRCSLRPTKLNSAVIEDTRGYFVSKKFRPVNLKTLATIYEEPKVQKNGSLLHVGTTKLRRINFNTITKDKLRKRKTKVKRIVSQQKSPKKGRLSMDAFLARLGDLMGSSSSSSTVDKSILTSLVNCKVE